MCLCVRGGTEGGGGGLNQSPTVGSEQTAANHIAHAANGEEGKSRQGRLSLKGTGGLFSEIEASMHVKGGR